MVLAISKRNWTAETIWSLRRIVDGIVHVKRSREVIKVYLGKRKLTLQLSATTKLHLVLTDEKWRFVIEQILSMQSNIQQGGISIYMEEEGEPGRCW